MAGETGTDEGLVQELKALKDDFQSLKSEVKDLISAVGGNSTSRIDDVRTRIAEMAQRIRSRAEEQAQQAYKVLLDSGQQAVDKTREQIQTRPLSYVGTAFVVGLVLGFLVRRR